MTGSNQEPSTTVAEGGAKPGPRPAISVVICTRDRAESLRRTLGSLVEAGAELAVPWELLVVDNGSSDHTPDVIQSFAGRLPVRRVDAPVAGLSNARNRAIEEARGDHILWTDDDVTVSRGWLSAYAAAFASYPDVALFGGGTEPVLEEPATPWFAAAQDALEGLLAIRRVPEGGDMAPPYLPYGLNYAVRADAQRRHRYDPRLGVAPGRRAGGEENRVMLEIFEDGGTGRWVEKALVRHHIPAARQTEAYVEHFYRSNAINPVWTYEQPAGLARLRRLWREARVYRWFARKARRARKAGDARWVALYRDAMLSRGRLHVLLRGTDEYYG